MAARPTVKCAPPVKTKLKIIAVIVFFSAFAPNIGLMAARENLYAGTYAEPEQCCLPKGKARYLQLSGFLASAIVIKAKGGRNGN